jgi:hypothetical protein
MKKYSFLLAVIALVLSSLACQTIMGGGNGVNAPGGNNGGAATAAPAATDSGNITVGGASPFPVASDATNVVSTPETVTYQTKLTSDQIIKFYQDEFGKKGYTEDKSMSVNFNGAFTMGFDGHESGKKIIIGGAPLGGGSTTVTIALQ